MSLATNSLVFIILTFGLEIISYTNSNTIHSPQESTLWPALRLYSRFIEEVYLQTCEPQRCGCGKCGLVSPFLPYLSNRFGLEAPLICSIETLRILSTVWDVRLLPITSRKMPSSSLTRRFCRNAWLGASNCVQSTCNRIPDVRKTSTGSTKELSYFCDGSAQMYGFWQPRRLLFYLLTLHGCFLAI